MMPPRNRDTGDLTLVDALLLLGREQPDKIALIELAGGDHESLRLTYLQLLERIQGFATVLQRRGYHDQPIIVACSAGADYLVAVVACMFAGAIAVPMPEQGQRTSQRWVAVLGKVEPAAIIVDASALPQSAAAVPGPDWLTVGYSDVGGWQRPEIVDRTIAFVQFTSGSTGAPKGAVISHGALTATRTMIRQAFDHRPDWTCVTWLPPWHDMGLVGGLLQPLGEGMTVVMLPALTVVQRPMRWLRAIDRYRAHVSGGPGFGYAACIARSSPAERAALDLSCWQLAFCGAEPVSSSAMAGFAAAFAPARFAAAALYACYGLAEATLFVSGPARGSGMKAVRVDRGSLTMGGQVAFAADGRLITACGRAWGSGTITIVDPSDGSDQPAGQVGEICVSGPHLASGYWRLAQDPAFSIAHGEHKLKTGDLGFMHDGELYVAGRLKEIIIVRGAKYHAEDIEEQARNAHPALAGHAVAAFATDDDVTEHAVVVAETRRCTVATASEIESTISAAVLRESGLRIKAVLLVRPGSIPRTTSGKVQRHTCRQFFERGSLVNARAASGAQVQESDICL